LKYRLCFVFLISYLSGFTQNNHLDKLLRESGYVLRVEVVSRPERLEWLGVFLEVKARVVEDIMGNSPIKQSETICILIPYDSAHLILSDEKHWVTFLHGTSLACFHGRPGFYFRIITIGSPGCHADKRKDGGISVRGTCYSSSAFRAALKKEASRKKVSARVERILQRRVPDGSPSYGFHRIWVGQKSKSEYANGVYWLYWSGEDGRPGTIFSYDNGRVRFFNLKDYEKDFRRLSSFLRRNGCSDSERWECLNEIQRLDSGKS